ncbi:MAG: nuclear transport factor 2 family protein [Gemmatimonadales bacterium]
MINYCTIDPPPDNPGDCPSPPPAGPDEASGATQPARRGEGRSALRAWFVEALQRVETTIHLVANHVIDFDDADHARGVVYCRDEVDRGSGWDVGYIQYWDHYERRDGVWYFVRRDFHRWFMVDVLTRPRAGAGLDQDGLTTGRLPEAWPSWGRFWDEVSRART